MNEYGVRSPVVLAFQLAFDCEVCGVKATAGMWVVKVGDDKPEVLDESEFHRRFEPKGQYVTYRDKARPWPRVVPMYPQDPYISPWEQWTRKPGN